MIGRCVLGYMLTILALESIYSLSALESKLVSYISDPESFDQPFVATDIPKISRDQAAKEAARMCCFPTSFHLMLICFRPKHTGDHWRSLDFQGGDPTPSLCGRDAVQLCPAIGGGTRTGVIRPCPQQQYQAVSSYRERDRIPSVCCQAHLQGAHRVPGKHASSSFSLLTFLTIA